MCVYIYIYIYIYVYICLSLSLYIYIYIYIYISGKNTNMNEQHNNRYTLPDKHLHALPSQSRAGCGAKGRPWSGKAQSVIRP